MNHLSPRSRRQPGPRVARRVVPAHASLLAGSLLIGCQEFTLGSSNDEQISDPLVVEEIFTQTPLPQVDILWVIDHTPSMADEHAVLGEALGVFFDGLQEVGVSWQLGVVNTDIESSEAGVLLGNPWILTANLPDAGALLQENAAVGVLGLEPAGGLGSAWLALNDPLISDLNRGFRREDASLHVIVVSDNDDSSESILGSDPASAFLDFLDQEAEANQRNTTLSAVVGDAGSGCSGSGGTALPADTYLSVAEASGGATGSICETDLSGVVSTLSALSVEWQDTFVLQAEPETDTLRVSVNDSRLDEGWTYVAELNAIRFDPLPSPGASIRVRYTLLDSDPAEP